jgi:hypothetical protein
MPHQEIYLALLDEQASRAYAAIETALGDKDKAVAATTRAAKVHSTIESEYYDPQKLLRLQPQPRRHPRQSQHRLPRHRLVGL